MPQSFADAAANESVLQVVFSILFAVALSHVRGPGKQFMLSACESLSEVTFKFVALGHGVRADRDRGCHRRDGVPQRARGAAKLLALLVGRCTEPLSSLCWWCCSSRPRYRGGCQFSGFIRAVREPWLIAFSTASSEAALPLAMEREQLGVPRRIVAFVLPAGYSFNLDGSTLYLALASVFAAQAAGIDMPISAHCWMMMLTLMLTSKGVAAVPRAALRILSGALAQFGLPFKRSR